ncbi:MAG: poly-gamma-glutamate hydrolase family protein [Armatimonadota bacterium]
MKKIPMHILLIIMLLFFARAATAETTPESDQKIKYASFSELSREEKPDVDFRVAYRPGRKSFLLTAPHGGAIEPGSTEIAAALAGDQFGLYTFNGLKRDSSVLYLPSTNFDEPELVRVTNIYSTTISVHVISGTDRLVYIGGRYRQLTSLISQSLKEKGYDVKPLPETSPAFSMSNFINKTAAGGVQLEISSALAEKMFRGPITSERVRQDMTRRTVDFTRFAEAVRLVLQRAAPKGQERK